MPYQVGNSCFSTRAEAAVAACINFDETVTVLPSGEIWHTFCAGVSIVNPHLGNLRVVTQKYLNGTFTSSTTIHDYNTYYQSCLQQDYVDASIKIGVAILTAWAAVYGIWWLYKKFNGYLTWSRGDD